MISKKLRIFLKKEIHEMKKTFPCFKYYNKGDDVYLRGQYRSTSGKDYQLKLMFSEYFPDRIPELYILWPEALWKYGFSGTINQLGNSHQFHTLTNDSEGHIQICHYSSETWHAACSSVGVMKKGILWIEAYENHLVNGETIDSITLAWKKSEDWKRMSRNLYSGLFNSKRMPLWWADL